MTRRLKTHEQQPVHHKDMVYIHYSDSFINQEDPNQLKHMKWNLVSLLNRNNIDNVTKLTGICKTFDNLTTEMQHYVTNPSIIILYISNNQDIKAAATLFIDYEIVYEDENNENNNVYQITQIGIPAFCSKTKGYGTKLMNNIKQFVRNGKRKTHPNFRRYHLIDLDANIFLNPTDTSLKFYQHNKFDFDSSNNICTFNADVDADYLSDMDGGKKTKSKKQKKQKSIKRLT